MSKKDVHVTPRSEGGWGAGREGAQRRSSLHDTQAAAAAEGRRLARQDGVEFNLHGRNGAPAAAGRSATSPGVVPADEGLAGSRHG
jgi:hypothetical protein